MSTARATFPGPSGDRAFATRRLVGVWPAAELEQRHRLLAAFERLFAVRFVGRAAGDWRGLDGLVALGELDHAGLESLSGSVPFLFAAGEESGAPGMRRSLRLADHVRMAPPLRGTRLHDVHAVAYETAAVAPGALVLAELGGVPAWTVDETRAAPGHRLSVAPAELGRGESLRERLIPDRSLAVLGLTHFLGDLTRDLAWQPPPLRASLLLDDPNLQWPSYGHLRYGEALDHAGRHGYHVSIAMIPLDAWLVHPRVASLFRAGSRHLSLAIHGNDHDGPELGRTRVPDADLALAAQALARVASFERRTGISVDRVMVPPHEVLSESAARALKRCGYEAACTTRPFPWVDAPIERPWAARPREAGPLPAWGPLDAVVDGLPMLLRADLASPREDLALRAFLGQPLILYGHHDVLADGLDVFAQAAADIGRVGAAVRWGSLATMTRLSVETRRAGSGLDVRMLARRVEIEVPEGTTELSVNAAAVGARPGWRLRVLGTGHTATVEAGAAAVTVPVDRPGPCHLVLDGAVHADATLPPRRVWPILRRTATQARDRSQAVRLPADTHPGVRRD